MGGTPRRPDHRHRPARHRRTHAHPTRGRIRERRMEPRGLRPDQGGPCPLRRMARLPERRRMKFIPLPRSTMDLADHIEMDHERELAPGTTNLQAMHNEMHASRDDWNHAHNKKEGNA